MEKKKLMGASPHPHSAYTKEEDEPKKKEWVKTINIMKSMQKTKCV